MRIEETYELELERAANPTVYLYDGAGCTGKKLAFTKNQGSFGDFYNRGFNDKANGIEVPPGAIVDLYQHAGYKGWKRTFRGPIKVCDLASHSPARNNDASSLRISLYKPEFGGFSLDANLEILG